MERDAASGAELVLHWTVNSEDAGDRRRCPHRQCASDDLQRPASAGAPSAPAEPVLPVSASSDPTDAYLAKRIAEGDAGALQVVYDRYAATVYGLALAIVREQAATEAVLAETFVRIWAHPAPPAVQRLGLAARLLVIARTLAIEEVRGRRAKMEPGTDEWAREAGRAADADAVHARVMRAVAGLPDDQRRALELAYFEGLTEQEIAQRLGRSVGQVRRLLRLGFARLQACLDSAGTGAAAND